MNLLITSAGRRVGLMNCFRESMRKLDLSGAIHVIDAVPSAPAFHAADYAWLAPRCTTPAYSDFILELCRRERIDLVVPTIDTELAALSALRPELLRRGTWLAVSDPAVIAIAADKQRTNSFFREHGFPTVRQALMEDVSSLRFPVIVKPWAGSASAGVCRFATLDELAAASPSGRQCVVEEVAPGIEFTVNVYVNREGRCVCATPHERMEVRSGEVSKAVTAKNRLLMQLASDIAEALPGARGALNIQMFAGESGIRVIEINARFGGGYPLAHRAGAEFTRWLLEEVATQRPAQPFDGWISDLAMLRYDEAVFVSRSAVI